MKQNLQEAILRKDPELIERALDSIDLKIPPAQLSDKDKEMISQAKTLQEKLEAYQRMYLH